MNTPIIYSKDAFEYLSLRFYEYWLGLPWEDRGAPRREAFVALSPVAYTYGKGAGIRTYNSSPVPLFMLDFWKDAEEFAGCKYELCFCNGYSDEKDHLGWHADDSDSVDDERPILIVSIGAEREIYFRDNERTYIERLKLGNGSGTLMKAGMQDTHQHKIPKHSAKCGPRISFTFRGLA